MPFAAVAPWACDPLHTRGRRHYEAPAPTRTDHQRDRDRIVHSSAFRRLVYKTQVFVNHEGDLFRTRLTHSLEVAQIGRSIARPLGLNEDLVEAICLAHDLGHTPFGHAGQDALNTCMAEWGGFEHNLQSLRVVDSLEARYPSFDGLNLTWETREGILKHCSRRNAEALLAQEPDSPAARFVHGGQPSLEAQLANLADAIAYNAHDVDDGVRSGLLRLEQLHEVPWLADYLVQVQREHPALAAPQAGKRLLYETIRRVLSAQVYDVIAATQAQLQALDIRSVHDVRACGQRVVTFSAEVQAQSQSLKQFLMRSLYRHPQVMSTMGHAQTIIRDLFGYFVQAQDRMPERFAAQAREAASSTAQARVVADFIAGMTDRYAARAHHQLTGLRLLDDAALGP